MRKTALGKWPRRAGFTLVEMLMVLGVMGVLAGMGFSGIQGLRQWLKDSADRALFMELQTACRLYYLDHGVWPDCFAATEVELTGPDPCLGMPLAPYMETRWSSDFLEKEFEDQTIHLVIDKDRDHWIRPVEFFSIGESERPGEIWDHVVVYSLDREGQLRLATWKE